MASLTFTLSPQCMEGWKMNLPSSLPWRRVEKNFTSINMFRKKLDFLCIENKSDLLFQTISQVKETSEPIEFKK